MAPSTKKYPIQRIVNWYCGNYCARKCFDKSKRQFEHWSWLQEFAKKHRNLKMTHREFLDFFNDHLKICSLDEDFKRKIIGWHANESLNRTPNYDSNRVIIKNGRITLADGELEQPKCCLICEKLGMH